jgi:hypothetical protein
MGGGEVELLRMPSPSSPLPILGEGGFYLLVAGDIGFRNMVVKEIL